MESIQSIKKRLKSVQNIHHITKAMELVAATKMRKSQEIALNSRPYAFAVLDLLADLSRLDIEMPAILTKRLVKKTLFALLASDKGLVGSFNSAIFKKFDSYFKKEGLDIKNPNYVFLAVGEKANNFLQKKGVSIFQKFVRIGDYTLPSQTKPIADFLIKGYLANDFDKAVVFSTNFRTAFLQQPARQEIFPVDVECIKQAVKEIIPETGKFSGVLQNQEFSFGSGKLSDYLIEPSSKKVLGDLTEHLISMQVFHLVSEANASEHAAKRVAMKNASDNASDLTSKLTLFYNKSRQALITQEISEIVSGGAAQNS